MAAAVAQATDHDRVVAVIANGTTLLNPPTAAQVARMDREGRVPIGPRTFWHWYLRFDWRAELEAMPFPKLVYLGTEDPAHRKSLPRVRRPLAEAGVTVLEFDGLDHGTCWEGPAVRATVLPEVLAWLDAHA